MKTSIQPHIDRPPRDSVCRPVFLAGMNGSGTTMLRDCLGRHPGLYGFPRETRLIPHLIATLGKFGDLSNDDNFLRLWEEARRIPAFVVENAGCAPPVPDDWRARPRTLEAVIDAIFRYFAEREGKIRWCEKTPQHIQHLIALSETFPNAKFVHIIRDGRDCAASLHRRWNRKPELTIYRWKTVVKLGRDRGRQIPDRYFELKYEDLTQDPEYWMKKICEFIDLPFHEDVLISAYPQKKEKTGEVGRIEPNTGRWRNYFSAGQIERFESVAGAYLAELGYPVVTAAGSKETPAAVVLYWRVVDYIRQFLLQVTRRVQGKTTKPWYTLLALPAIGIKLWRTNKH